jgi:hypothetical protein
MTEQDPSLSMNQQPLPEPEAPPVPPTQAEATDDAEARQARLQAAREAERRRQRRLAELDGTSLIRDRLGRAGIDGSFWGRS